MKKKIFKIILFAALVMSLTGCQVVKKVTEKIDENKVVEFKKGVLTETTFTSEYMNLSFELPKGYIMATEQQMLEASDLGAEIADLDEDMVDYAKAVSVHEMMATAEKGIPNVLVMSEKLNMANMSDKTYLDSVAKQLKSFKNMDYTISSKLGKTTIAGEEYTSLSTKIKYGSITFNQVYYVRMMEGRAIAIIISYMEDQTEERDMLLSTFKALK